MFLKVGLGVTSWVLVKTRVRTLHPLKFEVHPIEIKISILYF